MLQRVFVATILTAVATATSGGAASALTTKQKMETCTFGANDQKLQGAARKSFMSKCMANERAPKPAAKPKT